LKDAPGDNGMDEEISSSEDEKDDEGSIKDEASGSEGELDNEDELDNEEEDEDNERNGSDDDSDQEIPEGKRKAATADIKSVKRRKLEDYSSVLAKHHKEFKPYLNNTIQKWNTKTQVAVGRAGSKNFSAFEQSTLQQIEHILADKARLIRRTQLRRSDFKIFGQVKREEENTSEETKDRQAPPDVPAQEVSLFHYQIFQNHIVVIYIHMIYKVGGAGWYVGGIGQITECLKH